MNPISGKSATGQGNGFANMKAHHPDRQSYDIFADQRKRVLKAFEGEPKTMLEVSKLTGCERASICWYMKYFRNHDLIKLVRYGLCSITKYRAGFYMAKV